MTMTEQCLPNIVKPSISFTGITQTSALPFLPFPLPAAPSTDDSADQALKAETDCIPSNEVLQHVRQLLGAAKTTYSCVPTPTAALHAELKLSVLKHRVKCSLRGAEPPFIDFSFNPFAAELAGTNPGIFDCQSTGMQYRSLTSTLRACVCLSDRNCVGNRPRWSRPARNTVGKCLTCSTRCYHLGYSLSEQPGTRSSQTARTPGTHCIAWALCLWPSEQTDIKTRFCNLPSHRAPD